MTSLLGRVKDICHNWDEKRRCQHMRGPNQSIGGSEASLRSLQTSKSRAEMAEAQTLAEQRAKSAVALLLTFVAGIVDILGYLGIYHIFTAHLTGTTVHLGQDLMQRNWPAAAMAASVVAGFFCGSVAGRAAIEAGARVHFSRVASLNLVVEAVLLAIF